ncbi:hypothetical protein NDU88_004593 [Pleurodeles waltl]|uniref:Uncharacterized protein n=1 Tax=Pleurodeles waltl TaxID=8319 RepID=A0AAV7TRP6_PLEWA|nr:hypothetical protein NDU88_004593 [Pleurodeles waltl]
MTLCSASPNKMSSEDEVGSSEEDVVVCSVESSLEVVVMVDEWKVACDADGQIREIKRGLSQGWTKLKCKENISGAYKQTFEELSVVKGKDVLGLSSEFVECQQTLRMHRIGLWVPGRE